MLFYNTNFSHQNPPLTGSVNDIEIVVLRLESGEGLINNCQLVFTSDSGYIKVKDVSFAGEGGIYLLAEAASGNVGYIQSSATYTITQNSTLIILLSLDTLSGVSFPSLNLIDFAAYPTSGDLATYPPQRILSFYPSGVNEYGVPELLVLAHQNAAENTGVVIFGFTNLTANSTRTFPKSYNPFVTSQGCTVVSCSRCFAAKVDKCAQCDDSVVGSQYYLANIVSCTKSVCPARYYSEGVLCKSCHFSCLTCTGPLINQCLSCDSSRNYQAITSKCVCKTGYLYTLGGSCSASCATGQSGYTSNMQCKDRCSDYLFHYVNYASNTGLQSTPSLGAASGSHLLEFSPSADCLMLPGPSGMTAVPNQFTFSFWLFRKAGWTDGIKNFIWGFNTFKISGTTTSGIDVLKFTLSKLVGGELTIPSSPTVECQLTIGTWNYIAVSVRRVQAGIDAIFYIVPLGTSNRAAAGTVTLSTTFDFPTYANKLLIGCEGSLNSATGNVNTLTPMAFSGYIREIVYQQIYHEITSLNENKFRVYSECLQIYKQVMAYWRCDEIETTTTGYKIKDSSSSKLTHEIAFTHYPIKSSTTNIPLASAKWDNIGECVDLFPQDKFHRFSVNPKTYPYNGLEYSININEASMLFTLFLDGDEIRFYTRACGNGQLLQSVKVTQGANAISLEKNKFLSTDVIGKFVEVCYYRSASKSFIKLGQVYFANTPTHIYPSHGVTDKEITKNLQFQILGGDQSLSDTVTLLNINNNVLKSIADSALIDESSPLYPIYTFSKQGADDFKKLPTADLDAATYTLLWKPGFMTSKVTGNLVEYKNLFTLWRVQKAPLVRFPEGAGQNILRFKTDLYYPNIVGPGQADGDEIVLCYLGCDYSNKKGGPFIRKNGRYPPLWLGEETGVSNLLDNMNYDRVFFCWRPAARALIRDPSEDVWEPIYEDSLKGGKGLIRINNIVANKDLAEIIAINPPMENAILYKGQNIWFQLSKCEEKKMKPSRYLTIPGKVQIVHLIYSSLDRTSYSTEVIWEQQFSNYADVGTEGFTVGKIFGDSLTCNFTLTELSNDKFLPGHRYQLIIYSRSFLSPITNEYFLGNLAANLPQFKFEFSYQEFELDSALQNIYPSQKEITLAGTNFGTRVINGEGIVEVRRLYGVNLSLSVDPPCGSGTVNTSYVVNSLDGINNIKLTDLDLETCKGKLYIEMQLMKIVEYSDEQIWEISATPGKIEIGEIACSASCKTCSGIGVSDCTSCDTTSAYPYLNNGKCQSICDSSMSRYLPLYNSSTNEVLYFQCSSECPIGYYPDPYSKKCLECNSPCLSCSSGAPKSCTSCKGYVVSLNDTARDYLRQYLEKYSFMGMCMESCPIVINDFSATLDNLVITDNFSHTCEANRIPQNTHPIVVSIQMLGYSLRVNGENELKLRALIDDPTHNLVGLTWYSTPPEDFSTADFYSSDKRVFVSYDPDALNNTIVTLNKKIFIYKSPGEETRIVVKAKTDNSISFDIAEIIGNRPPDLRGANVELSPSSLTTLSSIDITITNLQDVDDTTQVFLFRVYLIPNSLALPDVIDSTMTVEALAMRAQLTPTIITLFPGETVNVVNTTIEAKSIYIPPLIKGPQEIADGIYSSIVSSTLYIICEDKYQGSYPLSIAVNISEAYVPSKRNKTIQNLYLLTKSSSLTWNKVTQVSNTLRTIIPESKVYFMSLMECSRDQQCGNGSCVFSAGRSACVCQKGFAGSTCELFTEELVALQSIVSKSLDFLNITVCNAVANSTEDNTLSYEDTNMIDDVASTLAGLLILPEAVNASYLPAVKSICNYMVGISMRAMLRLNSDSKANILNGINAAINFVLYQLKKEMTYYYSLEDKTQNALEEIDSIYSEDREKIVNIILTLREGLYKFASTLSISQYPGTTPFAEEYSTFDIFVSSENKATLFGVYENYLGIQTGSETGFVWLPISVINSLAANLSVNEEFKIRLIQWKESPYLFSTYHSQMFSSVMNLAILDSNGKELPVSHKEPIIAFLPISNLTKYFPTEIVKCKYMNDSLVKNITRKRNIRVNVNDLNITEKEKLALYPEWTPGQNLVVDYVQYYNSTAIFPEFVDDEGITGYGNGNKISDFIGFVPCAAYHLSEFAAIVERKKTKELQKFSTGFYYDFTPLSYWETSLGFYVCLGMVCLFGIFFFVSWAMDKILIPQVERSIEKHREEYSRSDLKADAFEKDGVLNRKESMQQEMSNLKLEFSKDEEIAENTNSRGEDDVEKEKEKDTEEVDSPSPKKMRHKRLSKIMVDEKAASVKQIRNSIKPCDPPLNLSKSPIEDPSRKVSEALSTTNFVQNADESNPVMLRTSGKDNLEEGKKDYFAAVQPEEIKPKRDEIQRTVDIFSEVHIRRREEYQYSFKNSIIQGSMILNFFFITSTTFRRPLRCIMLFLNIYFQMFFSAVFLSGTRKPIDQPGDFKRISEMVGEEMWIPIVTPLFTLILLYIFAGLFKISDYRILKTKTYTQYLRLM